MRSQRVLEKMALDTQAYADLGNAINGFGKSMKSFAKDPAGKITGGWGAKKFKPTRGLALDKDFGKKTLKPIKR